MSAPDRNQLGNVISVKKKAPDGSLFIRRFLRVYVPKLISTLSLPLSDDGSVASKNLRRKVMGVNSLLLVRGTECFKCPENNGVIYPPAGAWQGEAVWALIDPDAFAKESDQKWNALITKISLTYPPEINEILPRFKCSTWEELYGSPRFSPPFHCLTKKFTEYRIGVIHLFTQMILRIDPEKFDLFTMFRISEGDAFVCNALKHAMKESTKCMCCDIHYADEVDALQHFFDLHHAEKSRGLFSEPVYVSGVLEYAHKIKIFDSLKVIKTGGATPRFPLSNRTSRKRKTSKSKQPSVTMTNNEKRPRAVKSEIVDLTTPPGSPSRVPENKPCLELTEAATAAMQAIQKRVELQALNATKKRNIVETAPQMPPVPLATPLPAPPVPIDRRKRTITERVEGSGSASLAASEDNSQPSKRPALHNLRAQPIQESRAPSVNIQPANTISRATPIPTTTAVSNESQKKQQNSKRPGGTDPKCAPSSKESTSKNSKKPRNANLEPLGTLLPVKSTTVAPVSKHIVFSKSSSEDDSAAPSKPQTTTTKSVPLTSNVPKPVTTEKQPVSKRIVFSDSSSDDETPVSTNIKSTAVRRPISTRKPVSSSSSSSSEDEVNVRTAVPLSSIRNIKKESLRGVPRPVSSDSSSDDEVPVVPQRKAAPIRKVVSSSSSSSSDTDSPAVSRVTSNIKSVRVTPISSNETQRSRKNSLRNVKMEPTRKVESPTSSKEKTPTSVPQRSQSVRKDVSSSSSSSDSEDPSKPYQHPKKATAVIKPSVQTTPASTSISGSPSETSKEKVGNEETSTETQSNKTSVPSKNAATKEQPKKTNSKKKSIETPTVVSISSDTETENNQNTLKYPSTRRELEPYIDFVPEFKADLTTRFVKIEDVYSHFKVDNERALLRCKAFKSPVWLADFKKFNKFRRFLLWEMRAFCCRQPLNDPFVFYMYQGSEMSIYLADIDNSYARSCLPRCYEQPLTLNHLFSEGHMSKFKGTAYPELTIAINYIRNQHNNIAPCVTSAVSGGLDPNHPRLIKLLDMFGVLNLQRLFSRRNFYSFAAKKSVVHAFRLEFIRTVVNTNNLPLSLIKTNMFSIDKLVYLRDEFISNYDLHSLDGLMEMFTCSCGHTCRGPNYVVHVVSNLHIEEEAFELLSRLMESMVLTLRYWEGRDIEFSYTSTQKVASLDNEELKRWWIRLSKVNDGHEFDKTLCFLRTQFQRRGLRIP